jgi:uncharacterized repeat protein (TIGR02543 family)
MSTRLTQKISRTALILIFALFSATTAWADVVTLDENSGEVTLQDGDVLTGTGGQNTKVKIADGATVTLFGVNINHGYYGFWPGISCLGDAVIILGEGTTNNVMGGHANSGIYVPQDHTLTLQGGGTLNATGGLSAAGIGGGLNSSCGNITISGGIVTATGFGGAAGLGSGSSDSSCGNIFISGGTINATGNYYGAGIGSGSHDSSCGNITITNSVTMVTATAGDNCNNAIGAGNYNSTCGTVTIGGVQTGFITRSHFIWPITLDSGSGEVLLQHGDKLTGTGGSNTQVKIADGATVALSGVNITTIGYSHEWPGITCLGDAVIILEGGTTNSVKGGFRSSGIYVPQDHTLTLQGSGTLNATGGYWAAGIGSSRNSSCGNITISGGTVNATGGSQGAGIGSGGHISSSCGNITISGGIVTATGFGGAAGLGSGRDSSCGNITISGGTVTATGGEDGAGIGINSGSFLSCDTITITITNGVTRLTATKGDNCNNTIGAGYDGLFITVTIGGVETGDITMSPFVTYPYTVAFNANGGTGTMADMSFMYNVAQNLTANSFTRTGYLYEGWATSANGEKVYDNGQSVINLTQTSGDTVTLYAKWMADPAHLSVSGDEYTIYTATGWDMFCDLLTENNNFLSGKTVKLAADISVTRMAHRFKGSFNGQGHTLTVNLNNSQEVTAPFRYVGGATITNLVTAGTISTTKKFASGLVGKIESGAVSITNCTSNVTINSSVSGDGTHGGFVGLAHSGSLNITGCTFSGQMLGANTTLCGGFVGYTGNGATTTITDCLFAPSNLEIHSGWTFSRAANMNSVTITNSYYTETLGGAQGIQANTHEAISAVGEATTYDVSGISAYVNGMQYGTTFYYDPDKNFLRSVAGYGTGDGGYYLIASPLQSAIAPAMVGNLIADSAAQYDLYRLEQAAPLTWHNHKSDNAFMLEAGKGYLYANVDTVTLVFGGTPYVGDSCEVVLSYDPSDERKCWNLVGNPFNGEATLDRLYYILNADGTDIDPEPIEGSTPIPPCTAVFVKAVSVGDKAMFTRVTR